MDSPSARRAAFKQHEMACKEVAAAEKNGGGGGVDWQEEYIKKLDQDISEVKTNLRDFRSEVNEEFKDFRSEVKEEFKEFRSEVKEEFRMIRAEFKTDINGLKKEVGGLTRWNFNLTVTMIIGFLGVIAAILQH